MNGPVARDPFRFCTHASLIELAGLRARELHELLHHLKTVPDSVLYYHTHHFLRQHQRLSPEPPNDFAYWVTNVLLEDRLGEQLAAIDTVRFNSIHALRGALVSTLERYLARGPSTRVAPEGEELHFMRTRTFILATPYQANDLASFAEALRKVSLGSIYHHVFEARLRLAKGTNDFSLWLDTELGEAGLAKAIARLDPYTQTIESLRQRILRLITARLANHSEEPARAS